ncbi:MAG: prepilin-type N-terminal cleavage/methylation domain-containing protein [Bacilli bacterium]|nr:prepilin-type N-terminal cleavage/methylation domain-containing protein [Bacilli bacterium]
MRRKGFTLIELLAVIVILAIIAIISVPIITDLINKSRYGAFGVTKKNIERAAELYHAKNADDLVWDGDISYVTIGTLKSKKFLKNNLVNALDSTSINDDTKVLLYRKGRKVDYSLQLYDKQFFDWYQKEMVRASKSEDITLPTNVGDKVTIDLETLMGKGLVDELRLPLESENRCVGYVEIEKKSDNYEYNAYVDCLQGASTFASHYVSYGGKYLDEFNYIKETNDGGYIAVGRSNSETITKYGIGNNGKYDAIIVKFNLNGEVEWAKNFGGSNNDEFNAVVESIDGYVVVGSTSSDDGDINDYKGGNIDAVIVKYGFNGDVLYKRSYGSSVTTSTGAQEVFSDIIIDNNNYIIVGTLPSNGIDGDLEGQTGLIGNHSAGVILKMDDEFNTIWRSFFDATHHEIFRKVIKDSSNNYIIVGHSDSNGYDMEGLGWIDSRNSEAIIVKYDANGNILGKKSFRGSNFTESFNDVVEVNDGYITIGHGTSNDLDMEGLNKTTGGNTDAIIVKYDKNLSNVIWKKSFGGSQSDIFNGILKINNDEIITIGTSKSTDMDMNGIAISDGGYSDAIIVRYNAVNGNIINKKTFGGSNSESFKSIIKTNNNRYLVAGQTFSSDMYLKDFNKGHGDAILVNYDNNLNLTKDFKEPVVLIDKLKDIVPNYGTDISLKYDKIYTSNNPEVDLTSWCTAVLHFPENDNYKYGNCLTPFNSDDIKRLSSIATSGRLPVLVGENEYLISNNATNIRNWHRVNMYFASSSGNMEISNLKLKFKDGYIGSIVNAKNNNYIEPLVIISNNARTTSSWFFPNAIDLIKDGGSTGIGSYPVLQVFIKPKKSELSSVIFTASKNSGGSDGLIIEELRNFDMSITPTK